LQKTVADVFVVVYLLLLRRDAMQQRYMLS